VFITVLLNLGHWILLSCSWSRHIDVSRRSCQYGHFTFKRRVK